ncbi:MAG: hypothetical protein CL945_00230 [Dinoroseobacter sp.]|jgi:hypothetical protein|nr:hypothetical protein [Dinoroseobacter sp.]|tara:strand:+ start:1364 stop:2470 length:1107 start_codon:yes stop_codon:yes gene_type:complete
MALLEEIEKARTKVVTDGYDMSLGEIINLYRDKELVIDPVFQRLFRWDDERKTRFIESVILGIPIPPIFVYQDKDGVWELVDGLQRISTLLQLTGDLEGERAEELGKLVLNGTRFLPSLSGMRWAKSSPDANDGLGQVLQIEIKRSRIRVEILKAESDDSAKFELFQRLNTGGAKLTEQEVRNSMAVSLNRPFYDWLTAKSNNSDFKESTAQTQNALDAQEGSELALRFFAFRNVAYQPGLDVHEYLDEALIELAGDACFDMATEGQIFEQTFKILNEAMGSSAFKKWDGTAFKGMFLMSVYEVMATGVSKNLDAILDMTPTQRKSFIEAKARGLWENPAFKQNSGAGVRGTTRLTKLLPIAADLIKP